MPDKQSVIRAGLNTKQLLTDAGAYFKEERRRKIKADIDKSVSDPQTFMFNSDGSTKSPYRIAESLYQGVNAYLSIGDKDAASSLISFYKDQTQRLDVREQNKLWGNIIQQKDPKTAELLKDVSMDRADFSKIPYEGKKDKKVGMKTEYEHMIGPDGKVHLYSFTTDRYGTGDVITKDMGVTIDPRETKRTTTSYSEEKFGTQVYELNGERVNVQEGSEGTIKRADGKPLTQREKEIITRGTKVSTSESREYVRKEPEKDKEDYFESAKKTFDDVKGFLDEDEQEEVAKYLFQGGQLPSFLTDDTLNLLPEEERKAKIALRDKLYNKREYQR